ncbi:MULTISPECIES: beta-lactam sensor/signal transducer [Bacillus]|uniref:beta-lactam sensor/signal transducer n=1 Tax=Bacillus TaxID=1386 RepID=UPI000534F59F|nr:beta-lactam sensor/signal transducer [Bacillus pseudomycoides]MED1596855.1 beta-lactam sensor/signal transducer [Bacillus pseudomycoides]MED4711032.1 beta-lactam sensor/signal transducer [Bacillus pseudomycoides]OOR51575.1 beta-lactam sensor/signal transducer [Bacillus pseudomycoides]PEU49225.1 beta-lactam sensor/signal transducer [Bacillus pseudomycoides]PFY15534.1 beta-lactam sensor/signal transducer [Bacillus pseudomycoides]
MIDMFVNIYLPHFFDWVIETSIMASIVVGLILCIKILFRNKLTPRWKYLLWMILIVRLLLPWSPDSSYSIYSILSYSNDTSVIFHQKEPVQEKAAIDDTKMVTNENTYAPSYTQVAEENKQQTHRNENKSDVTFSFYTILLYIWLAGVIVLGLATMIMNRRLRLYIKNQPVITDERIVTIFDNCKKSMSLQQNIPLLSAGKISSPTVFGFFRPRVLLSSVHMKILDEQQLRYIFHHELAHIKRRDVGVNWLMHGLLILNWFNPILWYAYSCMREDQEMACDAFALTFIDSEEQIAYGHTIITLLEHYSSYYQVPSLANLSRNKRTLKRRIRMIKKFQKKSYRWSALGVVAIIAVSSVSLLNARADVPANPQKEQTEVKNNIKEAKTQTKVPIQQIVEKMIGTKEQAFAEFHVSEGRYEYILEEMEVARNLLTKEEFDQLIKLQPEEYIIDKKIRSVGTHENLEPDDQKKLEENSKAIEPLWGKIYSHFTFTSFDFPIKKPTYVAKGYELKREKVETVITTKKLNPIINSEYRAGEFGYTIYQSAVLEKGRDPFYFWINDNDKIENYEREGAKFTLAKMTGSNVKGMKMIVPAKGKDSAYQVVIIDDVLNKAELEKIMFSMLN